LSGATTGSFSASVTTLSLTSTGALTVTSAAGANNLEMDSGSTGSVNLGCGDVAKTVNIATGGTTVQNVNIGTGGGADVITIGQAAATLSLNGTSSIVAGTGDPLTITGNAASTWSTTAGALSITGAGGLNLTATNDLISTTGEIVPVTNNVDDLGSTSNRFKNLWLSGNANIAGNLSVSGTTTLGGGTAIVKHTSEIVTGIDIASTAAGAVSVVTVSVSGAVVGDIVTVSPQSDDAAWDIGSLTAFVESAGVVKLVYQAGAGGPGDPNSMSYRFDLWKH
jgi:hypothetical protein